MLLIAALALTVLSRLAEIAVVPTPSMEGTVLVGDHLLIDKALYGPEVLLANFRLPRLAGIRRGDLVSFRAPGRDNEIYLKRVAAIAGDSVEIRHGELYVNSRRVAEPYARRGSVGDDMLAIAVPAGRIFVLGDNRELSEDSRAFGFVPVGSVIGEPVLVCWSFSNRSTEWLDTQGRLRLQAYLSVLLHPLSKIRWARTGKFLE